MIQSEPRPASLSKKDRCYSSSKEISLTLYEYVLMFLLAERSASIISQTDHEREPKTKILLKILVSSRHGGNKQQKSLETFRHLF